MTADIGAKYVEDARRMSLLMMLPLSPLRLRLGPVMVIGALVVSGQSLVAVDDDAEWKMAPLRNMKKIAVYLHVGPTKRSSKF